MARYTGPKDRLSRREGFDLFGKGAKLTRLNVFPGVHGPKGIMRAPSQYGRQLREKQKVRRFYGVLEKQFRKYMEESLKTKGNTADTLFALLETRLDNIVYRLGMSTSRMNARQLVSHGHVLVDGKKVGIPSFQVRSNQTIAISGKMVDNTQVKSSLEINQTLPEWLERKATVGKVLRMPVKDEMEQGIEEQLIVEYYSR